MKNTDIASLTYEKALAELETIVENLQQQAVSIDELETQSKRAADLADFCKEKLRIIEQGLDNTFKMNQLGNL